MNLTESRIKSVIREELNSFGFGLNEELKKGDTFNLNGMSPDRMAKIIATKYGAKPSDFSVKRGMLVYEPKSGAKKPKVAKPEGMSVEDYKNKYVIPLHPELEDMEGEEWRPVPNAGRYFGGDADYGSYYEISNYGRLRTINFANAARSTISGGYDAPTKKGMQYTMNIGHGKRTTPNIKYMVADAFLGEHDPEDNMVIHLDGDYHNNRADNLKWVPRKKNGTGEEETAHEETSVVNERHLRNLVNKVVSESIKRLLNENDGLLNYH